MCMAPFDRSDESVEVSKASSRQQSDLLQGIQYPVSPAACGSISQGQDHSQEAQMQRAPCEHVLNRNIQPPPSRSKLSHVITR